mmetsp:Transcript_21866/g.52022  ORF Transcript_21866/g.52022 Transcript_21866/m.52022 type:complete len:273 (-) Transcript_21866:371-1189(-)
MMSLELNARNLCIEIENYSAEHSNDFGIPDGKDRIPFKKLMKLFEIKKKTPPEKQNLFRELVNELCELELRDGIGKVVVLKEDLITEDSTSYGDSDDDEPDYGYGEAAPDTVSELPSKADSDGEAETAKKTRTGRFKPPGVSTSGGLSVATLGSVGLYDGDRGIRRNGYRRRGSVTRYSIVGQEQVVDEYRKHEDVINQFRRDSLKLEKDIRKLSLSHGSNHSNPGVSAAIVKAEESTFGTPKKTLTPAEEKKKGIRMRMMSKGRSRFSLAF